MKWGLKMKIFTLFFLVFFLSSTSWADDPIRVVDPYGDGEENFSCTGKRDGRLFLNELEDFGYGKFRKLADLNFDGKEDIILSNGWCGNSECSASIFLRQSDGSYLKFEFGIHPYMAKLKRINEGEGRLTVYGSAGRGEVAFAYYKIKLNSLTFEFSKIVQKNDFEENWFPFFGESFDPEFAWCKNNKIKWSSSYE